MKMALVATVGTYYALDEEDGNGDAAAGKEAAEKVNSSSSDDP